MKIAVCCKAVPGAVSEMKIAAGGKALQYQGRLQTINECDDYALEEAIALKRAHGGEVTAVTVGSITTQDILYFSLAKGADKAVRIDAQPQDPLAASKVLAAALRKLDYDLILTGTQSRDTLAGFVGVAIAERLEIPFAYAVTQVERDSDSSIRVRKELSGGRFADVKLPLPALLCVQTGIQSLNYVPPARLLRARKQALRSLSLKELGLAEEELVPQGYHFLSVCRPERKGQTQFLEGSSREIAAALVAKIKEAV